MESFVSRYKNALVLIVVLVAQLLALAVQAKRPSADAGDTRSVSLIRYLVVAVITPPERLLHNIGLGIRGIWFGYLDLVHVRQENADLKNQMERLRLEQASIAEDAKQGQRLQYLLGFKERYIYKTLPAQVIGTAGTEQSRILYIDKGSKDGLEPEMPVVTADGIVGKLKDVFPHTSQVLEISDTTSGVGAILQTTRIRGVLKGNSVGEVQLINISPDDRIKPGEVVLTSGGDQIFPRGLPVGTVERVVTDPDRDPLVDVVVRPAANLARLEEVLVITNLGDETPKQELKDLAASEAEGLAAQKRASDVLSERLPSKIDPNAPADTNPQNLVDDAGNAIRPLSPPKPLRPDQFSPNATPTAAEMTPGQRNGEIREGTEEMAAKPSKPKPPAADTGEGGETSGETAAKKSAPPGSTSSAASGTSGAVGTAVPVHKPSPSVDGTGAAAAVVHRPAAAGDTATGTTPLVHRPASTTDTTGTGATAVHRPAQPAEAGGTATPVARRPATSAETDGTSPARTATQPAAEAPAQRPSSSAAASNATAANGSLRAEPKTRVIVDGPAPAVRKTSPGSTTGGSTATGSAVSRPAATGPATPRATTTASTGTALSRPANPGAQNAPVKPKGPEIVPDDGSRPPSAEKPPVRKPAAQSAEPASTPQRGPN